MIQTCVRCFKEKKKEKVVACSQCSNGYHMGCLRKSERIKPDEETWICPTCIKLHYKDFGYKEASSYTLNTFENLANRFKSNYFISRDDLGEVSLHDVEREYWKIVETGVEPVNVAYGSEIPASEGTSGFNIEKGATSRHDFNLMNLRKAKKEPSLHLRTGYLGHVLSLDLRRHDLQHILLAQ